MLQSRNTTDSMRALDWEALPYFLAVARGGSLRSGAQILNVNYGTLNRNIQALEASYGVRLFNRSRRGFSLTDAGVTLLPIAEQAEKSILQARRRVDGLDRTETGVVRFSIPSFLAYAFIAPILERFQNTYPGIDIELRITSEIEDLDGDTTDVSLRAAFEVEENVVAQKLYPLVIGILASKSYIEKNYSPASRDGTGLTWIGRPLTSNLQNLPQDQQFPNAVERHAVADPQMRLELLRNDCGMSHFPIFCEALYPELCRVPGTELEFNRWLWIVLHADLRKTTRVRRFVDFLSRELKELQPVIQSDLYQRKNRSA